MSRTIRIRDVVRDVGSDVGVFAQVNKRFFIRFIAFFGAVLRVAMAIRCSHYKSFSYSTSRQMYADVFGCFTSRPSGLG